MPTDVTRIDGYIVTLKTDPARIDIEAHKIAAMAARPEGYSDAVHASTPERAVALVRMRSGLSEELAEVISVQPAAFILRL